MALLDDYDRSKSYKANKPDTTPVVPGTSGYAGPQEYKAKPFEEPAPQQSDFTSSIDAFNQYFQKPVSKEEEDANRRKIARTQVVQHMASILPGMMNLGMSMKGAPSQTVPMAQPVDTRGYSDRLEKYRNQYAQAMQQASNMDRSQYLTQLNQWYARKQAHDKQEQAREDNANKLAQEWAKHGDTMAWNREKADRDQERYDSDRKSRESIAAANRANQRIMNNARIASQKEIAKIRANGKQNTGDLYVPMGDGRYGVLDASKLSDAVVGYIAEGLRYIGADKQEHTVSLVSDSNKPLTRAQMISLIGQYIESSPIAQDRMKAIANGTDVESDDDFWGNGIAYTPGVQRKVAVQNDSIPDLEFK